MILLWMVFYWLEVEIKNNGVLTASGDVAHKADFGMKTRPFRTPTVGMLRSFTNELTLLRPRSQAQTTANILPSCCTICIIRHPHAATRIVTVAAGIKYLIYIKKTNSYGCYRIALVLATRHHPHSTGLQFI